MISPATKMPIAPGSTPKLLAIANSSAAYRGTTTCAYDCAPGTLNDERPRPAARIADAPPAPTDATGSAISNAKNAIGPASAIICMTVQHVGADKMPRSISALDAAPAITMPIA